MNNFKQFTANIQSNIDADSLKKEFFRQKQNVMVKMGKAQQTTDLEFDEQKKKFDEKHKIMKDLEKTLLHYEKALKQSTTAHNDLSVHLQNLYDGPSPLYQTAINNSKSSAELDSARATFEEIFRDRVFVPLQSYSSIFTSLEKRCAERSRRRIDMDRYNADLASLQAKNQKTGVENPRTIQFQEKAESMALAYHALSDEIMTDFFTIDQTFYQFLDPLFASIIDAQVFYHKLASEAMKPTEVALSSVERTGHLNYSSLIRSDEASLFKQPIEAAVYYNFDTHTLQQNQQLPTNPPTNPPMGAPAGPSGGAPPVVRRNAPPPPAAPSLPTFRAKFAFQAQEVGELAFNPGDVLVIHQNLGDWWEAELRGCKGLVPSNYLEPC